jgi:hypothetical protein
VRDRRHRDREGRHDGGARGAHSPDVPSVPAPYLLQEVGWRSFSGRQHRGAQPALEVTHETAPFPLVLDSGSTAEPTIARMLARAREACFFTDPMLQPSVAAVCASDRSQK